MKLLIVESPAKCKKINTMLGNEYIVLATGGHINRLDGLKSIDIKNGFNPTYKLVYDKMKYVNKLDYNSKRVDEVIIGTDLDREGEAIGYHIATYLKLDINNTKRIIYNEISKSALTNAINNPTKLDMNMIKSQQSRQIIDLLVGYHLSPLLWKHIQDYLSAGRCQSPALRIIYDNHIELKNHVRTSYFHISGDFKNETYELKANIEKQIKESEIKGILDKIKKNKEHINISNIENKEKKINPPYPYITSSIQQDLANIFNLNGKSSMNILQKLYESGKITYIRTDSYNISKGCSFEIKRYIENNYGKEYYQYRTYGKSKNSQEAHECIRPVNIHKIELDTDDISNKVYKLIWKRTIESQMKAYVYDEFKYTISIQNLKNAFISYLNQTKFLGFKINHKKEDNLDLINKIKLNDKLEYDNIKAEQKYDNGKSYYTDGSLIKELEKLGIGRPSTYATIISTLFDKNYVEKKYIPSILFKKKIIEMKNDNIIENILNDKTKVEKNKITITELGIKVIKFLIDNFNELISYNYTNNLEIRLDEIAKGNIIWNNLIQEVYNSYYPMVLKLNKKEKTINKRLLGNYKSRKAYIYISKYGPTIELVNITGHKKYVNLDKRTKIDNIELENIKDLLELPKKICVHNDKEVLLKKGKYGYYLNYNSNNYSLKRIKNPLKISKEKALGIINT